MRQYISILLAVIALCLGSDGLAHSAFDGSAGLKSIGSQFSSEERYDLGSPLNPSSRRYTLGLDLVAQSRNTGTVQSPSYETDYYGYDGHGSVRFVFDDQTDWNTQVSDTYDYDAYGTLIRHQVQDSSGYLVDVSQSPGTATPNNHLYAGGIRERPSRADDPFRGCRLRK